MKLEALEQKHKELGEEIEKLKNKDVEWPREGDTFYTVVDDGYVIEDEEWQETKGDKYRHLTGNIFKTEAEANKHLARQIAIGEVNQIIKEENGDWVADWSDHNSQKHCLRYDFYDKRLDSGRNQYLENPMILDYMSPEADDSVVKRITQDQINLIWELG